MSTFTRKSKMNSLKLLQRIVIQQPIINTSIKRFKRSPTYCDVCLSSKDKRPCFDIQKVIVERGNQCHAKLIRSFLYTHYWPREPSVVGLWMPLDSPYLEILTEKFSNTGDRLLAFEIMERTAERKLIGVTVSNKVFPWAVDELEEWAHHTLSKPERHRMYFHAHCLKSPNLFSKYKTDYIYEVEVIATAAEVSAQGVGALLLKTVLQHSLELRHPLVQVVAVSQYTQKICEKVGMKRAWAMDYTEFVDEAGQRVFFPRRPHHTAAIYVKPFDQREAMGYPPCKIDD